MGVDLTGEGRGLGGCNKDCSAGRKGDWADWWERRGGREGTGQGECRIFPMYGRRGGRGGGRGGGRWCC